MNSKYINELKSNLEIAQKQGLEAKNRIEELKNRIKEEDRKRHIYGLTKRKPRALARGGINA